MDDVTQERLALALAEAHDEQRGKGDSPAADAYRAGSCAVACWNNLAAAAIAAMQSARPQSPALPSGDDWQPLETAPRNTPVLVQYHEWNRPNCKLATQVAWNYEGDWRPFPKTESDGETCYADRWKPLPTAASEALTQSPAVADVPEADRSIDLAREEWSRHGGFEGYVTVSFEQLHGIVGRARGTLPPLTDDHAALTQSPAVADEVAAMNRREPE